MNIRKTTLLFSLSLALFVGGLSFAGSSHASASYNGGRIIDNNVFLNANSMNAAQIQSFLASKGSGLASRSFVLQCYGANSQERQLYNSVGAPCDQNIPASQIIFFASRIYGINPQVILATLQKEQSLITTSNPTSWQLNQAMGYGCPTTGNCSGSSTFSYQIDSGAWVMRFHYERANGNNNWWRPDNSWVCGTEKNFYKPNLYPRQNVRFYDGNNVLYRTHYIENAATSSFYCYTPHAYNNPQGLFGRPAFGTTGQYYSGSYNFVTSFEQWFGSTNDRYYAVYHSQSPAPNIYQGQTTPVTLRYKNTGGATWYDSASAPSVSQSPVVLATKQPINRLSGVANPQWYSANRPTGLFSKVYEANGVTLASNQHVAQPGQIVEYNFNFNASVNTPPGTYNEYFGPIREGSPEWFMGADNVFLPVTINNSYKASYRAQSPYPSIKQNDSSSIFIQYKNTGSESWYDSATAPGANTNPVVLAADGPINRQSGFGADWYNRSRPTGLFSKVYEADGVTLASNQHVAHPGQIVEYNFKLNVHQITNPGTYREYFSLIREGAPSWRIDNATGYFDVSVQKANIKAAYYSQSDYPTISRGQSSSAFIKFRNAGNTTWYDSASVPSGLLPVRLASTWPINRLSQFANESWSSGNRPSHIFSKVYEADGVTLASNQHVAHPGQIVEYSFSLSAKQSSVSGQEYFQPILEGGLGNSWDMGGSAWLLVTIN